MLTGSEFQTMGAENRKARDPNDLVSSTIRHCGYTETVLRLVVRLAARLVVRLQNIYLRLCKINHKISRGRPVFIARWHLWKPQLVATFYHLFSQNEPFLPLQCNKISLLQ